MPRWYSIRGNGKEGSKSVFLVGGQDLQPTGGGQLITQSCHLHYCVPPHPSNYWTTNNTYTVVIVIFTGYRDTPLGVWCPTFQHCALAWTSACPIKNSESFFLHWTSNPLSSGHYVVWNAGQQTSSDPALFQIWTAPLKMCENSKMKSWHCKDLVGPVYDERQQMWTGSS